MEVLILIILHTAATPTGRSWEMNTVLEWIDAAEFEARVAMALAGPIYLTPCNEMACEHWRISCLSCRLKYARLEAEYKMETEQC